MSERARTGRSSYQRGQAFDEKKGGEHTEQRTEYTQDVVLEMRRAGNGPKEQRASERHRDDQDEVADREVRHSASPFVLLLALIVAR